MADSPPDALTAALAACTTRERRLVEELPAHGWDATKAGRAAGFRGEHVKVAVHKALQRPHVKAAVDALLASLEETARTKAGAIVERLGELATFDPGDVFDFTGDVITLRPGKDIPAAARRCIKKLKRTEERNALGGVTVRTEVEFHDRVRADELLGKYRKLWVEKLEHGVSGTLEEILRAAAGTPTHTPGPDAPAR